MKSDERVIGIIQARLGSRRLPQKVMAPILDKPMIYHMVERLRSIKQISDVVIATFSDSTNIPLCNYAKSENITYYAGSENDLLDRFYNAGKINDASVIVKVNGDCPLIDPSLIEKSLEKYFEKEKKPDMVSNQISNTFPEGMQFSIINFNTLSNLWFNLKNTFWREFMNMYFIENQKDFSVIDIKNPIDLSNLRWTVDYYEDLEFVREVYENLYKTKKFFTMTDVLNLIEKKPKLTKINQKYSTKEGIQSYNKLKEKFIDNAKL